MGTRFRDELPDRPEILRAGVPAAWLYVCGRCYSSMHGTDGFVPGEYVGRRTRLAEMLVKVGLWKRAPGGWLDPEYLADNLPDEEVKRLREQARTVRVAGGKARAAGASRNGDGKFLPAGGQQAAGEQLDGFYPADGQHHPHPHPLVPGSDKKTSTWGLTHIHGIAPLAEPELPFAEKWADRILPQIRETHRRGFWINLFRSTEQAVVVNSIEKMEHALANPDPKKPIANRAAYFAGIMARLERGESPEPADKEPSEEAV